jgi:glycosyltransferase involved in cell wall biosynthesis
MAAYAIMRRDVDVIHAHASSFAVVGLAAASTVFRVPIVNDCRDEAFRPWIVTSGFTPIWFSCASNIDDILIENGVPADRIVRLPVVNPSYVREYREPDREGGVNEIVFVGSIRSAKGVFVLLDALELLHEKEINARLTLIGDRPATENLRVRTIEKNLVEHIILTGRLNHRETLDRLAQADVLVLPSESEDLPRVVLEAQEVGTPIVATPVGGVPDVITHEKTGMLSPRTTESIANNVVRLAHDDDFYRCVVTNGLKRSESQGWDQVSEKLYEGYKRATSSEW